MAMTPENIGHARLVPPITPTDNWPSTVWMNSTPVNGSASMAISGTNLLLPGSALWNAGLAKVRLVPPPAPLWKPRPWAGSLSGGTTGGLSSGTVPPLGLMSAMRVKFVLKHVSNYLLLFFFNAMLFPSTQVAFFFNDTATTER